jgi:undecaprenyl-diphosphatase
MEWWRSALLGLVEGVTEFLPVSSTGHLILAERALGIGDDDASRTFAICIQGGAIAAVIGLYLPRIRAMLAGRARELAVRLFVAFVPAAVLGLAAERWIDAHLFGLRPVVLAWFFGGAAILLLDRKLGGGTRPLESIGNGTALAIGLFQCLALWPGTSRSLATILGGLLLGLSMSAAVEFSLLLGLLTLGAATAWKGMHHGRALVESYGVLSPLLGFAVAAISAWISVKWMIGWLERRGLALFGWYRVLLAAAVALWIFAKGRAGIPG